MCGCGCLCGYSWACAELCCYSCGWYEAQLFCVWNMRMVCWEGEKDKGLANASPRAFLTRVPACILLLFLLLFLLLLLLLFRFIVTCCGRLVLSLLFFVTCCCPRLRATRGCLVIVVHCFLPASAICLWCLIGFAALCEACCGAC